MSGTRNSKVNPSSSGESPDAKLVFPYQKLPVDLQQNALSFLDMATITNFSYTCKDVFENILTRDPDYSPKYMAVFVNLKSGYLTLESYSKLFTRFSLARQINTSREDEHRRVFSTRENVDYFVNSHGWHRHYIGCAIIKYWVKTGATTTGKVNYTNDAPHDDLKPGYTVLPRHISILHYKSYVVVPIDYGLFTNRYSKWCHEKNEKIDESKALTLGNFEANILFETLQYAIQKAASRYYCWYHNVYLTTSLFTRSARYGGHDEDGQKQVQDFAQQILESQDFETILSLLRKQLEAKAKISVYSFEAFLIDEIAARYLLNKELNLPKSLLKRPNKKRDKKEIADIRNLILNSLNARCTHNSRSNTNPLQLVQRSPKR